MERITLSPTLPTTARDKLLEVYSSRGVRRACGPELWGGHHPHPKQLAFLSLDHIREAMFGGSAGGGKSDALLMSASQFVCVPNYSALLLRQTYPQLIGDDGLIPRSLEWFSGTGARYMATEKRWYFPSGATITFGHAERDDDRYQFSGQAFQFVGMDEGTHWRSPKVYLFVGFARARKPSQEANLKACPQCGLTLADVPLRTRMATNPGSRGHAWVRSRFLVNGRAKGRVFIRSRIEDNPSLDRDTYVAGLGELDRVELAQLLAGDWEVREEGQMFDRSWLTTMRYRDFADTIAPQARLVRFWDMAATEARAKNSDPDWTSGALVALHHGVWYIVEIRRTRSTPKGVEDFMVNTADVDDDRFSIAGSPITVPTRAEMEGGSGGMISIDQLARGAFVGRDFAGRRPRGSKTERAKPLSIAAESGRVVLVDGDWNEDFLTELEGFPDGDHDDQVDSVTGAMKELADGGGTDWTPGTVAQDNDWGGL